MAAKDFFSIPEFLSLEYFNGIFTCPLTEWLTLFLTMKYS